MTHNDDEFRNDFYIRFQVFYANIQSCQHSWHQRTLHYEEILGSSYINKRHLKSEHLKC